MALVATLNPDVTHGGGLADDLAWLDAALWRAVETRRLFAPDALPGVYTSELELDALFARPAINYGGEDLPERWVSERLNTLATKCSLTPFDTAVLLLTTSIALDHRYARICAYLQDDLTRPYATPGLALELFGGGFQSQADLRSRFDEMAPLRALQFIRLGGSDSETLISRALQSDDGVASYLLGIEEAAATPESNRQVILAPPVSESLSHLESAWSSAEDEARPLVFVIGDPGNGRSLVARRLAAGLGRRMVVVREAEVSPQHVRDAAVRDYALCIAGADAAFEPGAGEACRALERAIELTGVPTVLTLARSEHVPSRFAGRETRLFVLPPLGIDEQTGIWRQEAAFTGIELDQDRARLLAGSYRLTGRAIAEAVRRASLPDGSPEPPLQRLAAAARVVASANLGRLGQEIVPRFQWDDIVVPDEVADVLREIILRVRYRPRVFGEWGFTERHARSRSLSALFAGPSGTGKTMAAEIVAGELGLPLYRVDLAAVVSKYIGETEKNLSQIFNEASSSSAVLFFDEADALFGKRSEVRDSHDRYANIEVSYLLQRMEDYDGIVILASNLRQNLDEAFIRRLHLTADFPFPDAAARLEIWRRTLPSSLPLAPDVDLPALAKRFRLSGGNIRNACVTSAFMAAADETVVAMSHLLRAVRREHQKMGKLLFKDEEPEP